MLQRVLTTALLFSTTFAMTTLSAADHYERDESHTAALFKVKHLGISYTHGRFNDVRGSIHFDAANPAASKVAITVQASSVDTHNEKRDAHLANPDFFDAKQFPELKFVSTEFKKAEGDTYAVTGDFTLHGVTKPLTISVTKIGEGKDPWGGYRIGFETTFTIKRSDFAMNKMLETVGDEVTITFSIEATKK
jgi:polyisoprenoid-binding protein YceI